MVRAPPNDEGGRMPKIMAAAAVVLASATLAVSATTGTSSSGTFFTFEAATGAHPVSNRSGGYDLDPVRDEVTGHEKTIRIFAGPREDAWSVELKAPEGQRLRPGVFDNVQFHQG